MCCAVLDVSFCRDSSPMSNEKPKIINIFSFASRFSLVLVELESFSGWGFFCPFTFHFGQSNQQTTIKANTALLAFNSVIKAISLTTYFYSIKRICAKHKDWEWVRKQKRMNYAAHHNAHHSFIQLPLAIEIPDTFSKFHLQQECLWKYYIIVSLSVLWTSCTLQTLCACKWKGRKLKRISTFEQEKKTQRKSNTAAHEHCYVRNFVKFTKHSSYFYDIFLMHVESIARSVCLSFIYRTHTIH